MTIFTQIGKMVNDFLGQDSEGGAARRVRRRISTVMLLRTTGCDWGGGSFQTLICQAPLPFRDGYIRSGASMVSRRSPFCTTCAAQSASCTRARMSGASAFSTSCWWYIRA